MPLSELDKKWKSVSSNSNYEVDLKSPLQRIAASLVARPQGRFHVRDSGFEYEQKISSFDRFFIGLAGAIIMWYMFEPLNHDHLLLGVNSSTEECRIKELAEPRAVLLMNKEMPDTHENWRVSYCHYIFMILPPMHLDEEEN
ncbi:hypothetical protein KIN20_000691 [Parelaphostrongylus tenuis]|uniref:Uncharacterized protein n=1 Tax=Parelaphostrongylus tenuis TaxID=148309 RepID=A0AAD5LV54_PARTN|nr:hypothetical protein KIN20_000691 [Parelaphostrongylus tenuis]